MTLINLQPKWTNCDLQEKTWRMVRYQAAKVKIKRGRWQIDISYSLDSERSAASDTAETKKWFCTRHHGNKISRFGSPKHQMNSIKSTSFTQRFRTKRHSGDSGVCFFPTSFGQTSPSRRFGVPESWGHCICTEPPDRKRWLLHSSVDCFLLWANLCSFCESFEGSGSCLRALPAIVWGEKRPRIKNLERGIKAVSVDTGISHPNLLPELECETLTEHHTLVLKKELLQAAGWESSTRCFPKTDMIWYYIIQWNII